MGRVFATSDWHGNLMVANKVFNFLQPDDTLYFLGDCADRGNDGIKIAHMLLNDSRVKFIKGNHEVFLEEGLEGFIDRGYPQDASLWIGNGGKPTIKTLERVDQAYLEKLYRQIKRLPTSLSYINKDGKTIILNHCGFTPGKEYVVFWDRDHFKDDWPEECPNVYIVHGHTPVIYLSFKFYYKGKDVQFKTDEQYKEEVNHYQHNVIRYCDGHKFDIDLGCVATNKTVLLDLDTFEEIYIKGE